MNDSIEVTIFVPCYNEKENVLSALDVIIKAFYMLALTYEIIVMDDCSTDNTYETVLNYIQINSINTIRIFRQERKMGLAYNFADAAFLGRGKYFRQVNGDADESVANLLKLFSHLGKADIIIPYHEDATARRFTRRLISKLYTIIINLITGYQLKYYNGMAIYLREHVMRWHSQSHGFGYQAELLGNLLYKKCTYLEVPLIAVSRKSGHSKAFTIMNVLSVMHTMLKLVLKRLSASYYDKSKKEFCDLTKTQSKSE